MIGNPITTMSIGLRWHLDGNVCAQPVCLLPSFLPLSRFASCCFCQHTRKNVSEGESFSTCTAHSYLTAGEDLLDFSLTVDSSKYSYSCFSYSFFSGKLFYWCLSLLAVVFLTLLIAIISQLLMIAGDIESNPGPKRGTDDTPGLDDLLCMSYAGEDGRDTRFRLMNQLQPHWRRLAVALKFHHSDITVMEHKDDPVFYLLSEWLRGANQERDSRPVTWGTLITALRDTNVQEEINVLEKHFVQTESAPVVISRQSALQKFDLIHTQSEGYTMQHGSVKVTVGPDVPKDLFMLLDEYSNMLLVVRTAELPQSSFFKLKFFLSYFCDEKLIRQCTNLCAIVDLLIESLKIYIFNIDTLTVSCKHFDNADVQVSVQQYKKLLDNFLSTTHVKDFKDALRTKVLDCSSVEEITLKLDESVNSNTLRELKKLVHHFFGNSSRALIHCKTGSGCVCITWLVPVSLVPTLRTMARQQHSQDLHYFERQGVLELVIGLRIEVLNPVIKVEATYKQKCKAKDKEIANIRTEMAVIYSRWQKEKEKLESELKRVRQEKSDYEDQCDKLENKIKKMQQQIFDFDEMSHKRKREVKLFQQKENLKDVQLTCVEAFKQGDHDEALRLLPSMQQPETVQTDYQWPGLKCTNVSLLHLAALHGWMDIVAILLCEYNCSSQCCDSSGQTPLHYAAAGGSLPVVQYLITEQHCDPLQCSNNGNLPLHIACLNGHVDVVRYLIVEQNCDPNSRGEGGWTPLQFACQSGNLSLILYLIIELSCDLALPNSAGNFPLHIACLNGHVDVVRYLIAEQKCDPNSRGERGSTLLHCACQSGNLSLIQYLVTELSCDLALPNTDGILPLHIACLNGHTTIVQWLLLDSQTDPLKADSFGRTAVDFAEMSDNSYELLSLFQPLLKSRQEYPIHSFVKVVLTGNSAAGKTSLAQVIVKQANLSSRLYHNVNEDNHEVVTLTAGIESHVIRSEEVGNLVLYDLAGQSEYYFSQSVMMETVMQRTPAIFINLVDLSKSEDEIALALHFWLTFTENVTFKTQGKSCIAIVCSHVDLLSEEEVATKTMFVKDLVERRSKKLESIGYIGMDCRKTNAENTREFFSLLSHCQKTISARVPSVSVYCHMLYAFLQTKLNKIACQVKDLISSLTYEKQLIIPQELPVLSDHLESLSDKGVIIYLKKKQCLEKSWVVVKREVILNDVNGVLFAPKYFRGYHAIASSTGIMRFSSIKTIFPQYDAEMLIELLKCLEFCHPVSLSGIETNLQPIASSSIEEATDYLLFFPSLLCVERPQYLTSGGDLSCAQQLSFGWCLGCMDYEYQFLTTRFLHVLLLRLAYTFSLPHEEYSRTHSLHGLERRCTVWTNGISWNNNAVRTVVEVIQQSRWVVVNMFPDKDDRPVEYSRHRSAVIRLVLDLQQELAPDLDTFECLISPSLLQQWPLDHLPKSDLFPIKDVARSVLCRKPVILSQDDCHQLLTSDAVFFEPYHLLSPSFVCELMDSSTNDQPVSPALLSEVRECCQQPQLESQSYLSLREHLDKMSIYAGRNPLVVAELYFDTVIGSAVTTSSCPAKRPFAISALSPLPVSKKISTVPVESITDVQHDRSVKRLSDSIPPPAKRPATSVDLSDIPDGTLDIDSHLPLLMVALTDIAYQWKHLSTLLGLTYFKLKEIEKDKRGIQMDCMQEMLAAWLQGQGGEYSKQALKTALQKLDAPFE